VDDIIPFDVFVFHFKKENKKKEKKMKERIIKK